MDNLKRSGDSDTEYDETKIVKRQRLEETINLGDKREQVINIIKREFENEISKRQEELHIIQDRLLKAQKTLHLLKYVIIKSFYDKKELKIVSTTEELKLKSGTDQEHKNSQSRIHPALKKLLGKKPITTYDFGRTRNQQQSTITSLIKTEFVDDVTKKTETTENEQNNKQNETNVQPTQIKEINVPIRNKQKLKYDVIIGNISKYSPSNNSQDASTHKWMVYVRGPRDNPDISHFVKKVRFFLHPSYQPNDIVEIEESPFHLSRRGWGEFPVRIQIHFQNNQNKPIDVRHNLKLDQNRTGRQTLGNETTINVWLYDNSDESAIEDVLQTKIGELKIENEDSIDCEDEDSNIVIKEEINQEFEIFTKDEPLDTFEPQPCCSKYLDSPQNEDLEFDNEEKPFENLRVFLVDHCYAGLKMDDVIFIVDRDKYKIKIPLQKFESTRQIVYFLFKSLPLVTNLAEDYNYVCCYPYVATTLEEYCSWNIGKRRCSEWYRAKQIKTLLQENKILDEEEWTIKFILMFGRAHAFTPLSDYTIFQIKNEGGKTIPNNLTDSHYKSSYTEYIPIPTLMENYSSIKLQCKEDNLIVDIEGSGVIEENNPKKIEVESSEPDSYFLPMCNYVKKCASQIDIYLQDEEIEPQVFHNSSERVILQSITCLAEELIRSAWANKVLERRGRNLDCCIEKRDIMQVLLQREEFDIFTNEGLGKDVT